MELRDRDIYADFLRALSLAVVVLGHWLELVTSHLKPLVRWTQWLTWLFQVLPLFFIVGGALNAASWSRSKDRGELWSVWVRRRARRLLVPLFPLIALWLLLIPVLRILGFPPGFIQTAALTAVVPTWFLGAYLAVVVFVPVTWALHRRFGAWVMVGLVAAIAFFDALARLGVPGGGDLNVLLVWGAMHQVGYFWHDDRLTHRVRTGLVWTIAAFSGLLTLVLVAGYPISMVVVDADKPNNAAPPTLALFALGMSQLGVVLAARKPVSRWLERPRVQRVVGAVGSVTLTVFLWHMTAILLVGALAWASGNWPEAPDIDGSRWAVKPFWLGLIAIAVTILVVVFRRVESWPTREALHPSRHRALAGLAAALIGITWIGLHGLDPSDVPLRITLVAVAVLFGGMVALDALPARRVTAAPSGKR